MKMKRESIFYRTSDLALASALSIYFPIKSLNKTDERRVVFIFLRNKDLDELIEGYFNRSLKLEPQVYFNAIKALKGRIYQKDK